MFLLEIKIKIIFRPSQEVGEASEVDFSVELFSTKTCWVAYTGLVDEFSLRGRREN